MIAVVDYGMGNLRSIQKAFQHLGKKAVVTSSFRTLLKSSHIVLPGVGHFGRAVKNLRALKLWNPLKEAVIVKKKPFLGICLGLQLVLEASQESSSHKGLSILEGKVLKFQGVITPHMGWNKVYLTKTSPLFRGIGNAGFFYFCHSYYAPLLKTTLGYTLYKVKFSSCINYENITLVQFHPEKSQRLGLKFLSNFLKQ